MPHDVITRMVGVNLQLVNFIAMQWFVPRFRSGMLRVRSPMPSAFSLVGSSRSTRTRKAVPGFSFFFSTRFSECFSERCHQKTCQCHIVTLSASCWRDAMFVMLWHVQFSSVQKCLFIVGMSQKGNPKWLPGNFECHERITHRRQLQRKKILQTESTYACAPLYIALLAKWRWETYCLSCESAHA